MYVHSEIMPNNEKGQDEIIGMLSSMDIVQTQNIKWKQEIKHTHYDSFYKTLQTD